MAGTDEEALLDTIERAVGGAAAGRVARRGAACASPTRSSARRSTRGLLPLAPPARAPAGRPRRCWRLPSPDPDAVAYHFQRAGDPRAARWLVRAGERAQRAYAWLTAAARYEAALALLPDDDADVGERGWLCYWIGWALRWVNQLQAACILRVGARTGAAGRGWALAAVALCDMGRFRANGGERLRGVAEFIAGVEEVAALPPEARERLDQRLALGQGHRTSARRGIPRHATRAVGTLRRSAGPGGGVPGPVPATVAIRSAILALVTRDCDVFRPDDDSSQDTRRTRRDHTAA